MNGDLLLHDRSINLRKKIARIVSMQAKSFKLNRSYQLDVQRIGQMDKSDFKFLFKGRRSLVTGFTLKCWILKKS
jgi:hypothetical protein